MEAEECRTGNTGYDGDRLFEGFFDAAIFSCTVMVSQNGLCTLGDAKDNSVENSADFEN